MPNENATVELALRDQPQAVMLTNPQLRVIANTDFVPKSMRGNVAAVLGCVARGRAMGIPDIVALNGIAIIEGKATLSAELMCAIVRAHGHSITGDVTAKAAKVRGRRKDNGDEMSAEFTVEMAEAAGLLRKPNWQRHPDDMMWARAVSKLCRRLFADCFAGGTYTPEDIADGTLELTADEVLDEPFDESAGRSAETVPTETSEADIDALIERLLTLARTLDKYEQTETAIANKRAAVSDAQLVTWLKGQIARAENALAEAAA